MDGLILQLRSASRRVAAGVACAIALIALLRHVPLWVACARGGASLIVLVALSEGGLWALARAERAEARPSAPEPVPQRERP